MASLSPNPQRPQKLPSPSPPAPGSGQPFLSEDVATSTALYKLATTPSPKINKYLRSYTPSPNDSRSNRNEVSDLEEDLNDGEGVSPTDTRGRRRRRTPKKQKKNGNDEGCVLSKGGYPEIPSGLGLGLAMPVLPSDPDEVYGELPLPLVTWRFSSITKPSSIYSPASPSPSDSIAGEELPTPSNLSIHTLTPGPAWPPPPSTVVSPVASPMPDELGEFQPDVDVVISLPPAENSGERKDSNGNLQTPASPLPPNIAKLLNEISSIPRPESAKSESGERHVTSVQAWVLDMPGIQQLRGRQRGHVEVRRMKSWRNLRAKMGVPHAPLPSLPSPPITPPNDSEPEQEAEEEQQVAEYNIDLESLESQIETDDEATPVPTQHATFETREGIVFDTTDYIPYSEMPIPSPANSFEIYQGRQEGNDADDYEDVVDDVEEVEEIIPAKVQKVEDTPDLNSDLVYEIEALLKSSPIRKESPKLNDVPDIIEDAPEAPEEEKEKEVPGTETPSSCEDFYTPAEGLENCQFFEDVSVTPINSSVNTTPTIRQTSMPSTPIMVGSGTPPTQFGTSSTGNTPRRPAIPERRSSAASRDNANNSIDGRILSNYPPVSLRPENHRRGKSVDSTLHSRRKPLFDRPAQRQRASSASAIRTRSMNDGPPEIPKRRSSIGKTGPSYELLPGIAMPLATQPSQQQPPLLMTGQRLSDIRSSSVYSQGTDRWSPIVFGGEQMAEVVTGDLMRSGSVKEVMVRSPSTKGKEFSAPAAAPAAPTVAAAAPTPTSNSTPAIVLPYGGLDGPSTKKNSPRIPSVDFGGAPDLNFGDDEDDVDKEGEKKPSGLELPVVFQVIPPTPAAGASKQLGTQTPQAISIPSTPAPTTSVTGDTILSPVSPVDNNNASGSSNNNVKKVTNGEANISKKIAPLNVHDSKRILDNRPRTAPERLNPDDFGSPPTSPQRPKLKSIPTKFRESKLSPWWRPRRYTNPSSSHHSEDMDSPSSSFSNARTAVGSSRPATASTVITTTVEGGSSSVNGGGRKRGRSIKIGKVEVEFVGLRELRRQMKMQKERKRRASVGSVGSVGMRPTVGVAV